MDSILNRTQSLFEQDVTSIKSEINDLVSNSSFLVLGGAGTIGQAVVKEIFKRNPKKLHVVDLSENNLAELVRDVRSSLGYINGDFQTFAIDIGSSIYQSFIMHDGQYDYVMNLSALKHVRSESDPFTLMRMIDVNIINVYNSLKLAIDNKAQNYFSVSTDKAANPVNMMGASKRLMEKFMSLCREDIELSTARFANVAFSDGSLLCGFENRMKKQQPIVAPSDIERYFMTPTESGQLCLLAALFGKEMDTFFPKNSSQFKLIKLSDLAQNYIKAKGYQPYLCEDEHQARSLAKTLPAKGQWPCLLTKTDTTGEKSYEEFYGEHDQLDLSRFQAIGVIKNNKQTAPELTTFISEINQLKQKGVWSRHDLIQLFKSYIPEFDHQESNNFLDNKM